MRVHRAASHRNRPWHAGYLALLFAALSSAQAHTRQASAPASTEASTRALLAMPVEQRADLLVTRHQYVEAIRLYQELPAPLGAVALNKLGVAYERMRLYPLARQHFEQAIAADPKLRGPENNLGTVFYVQGDLRHAEQHYRRALKADPRNAAVYNNLGTLYFTRRKIHKGMEAYQQALSLDPDIFQRAALNGIQAEGSPESRALINYYLAQTCAQAGKEIAALRYLERAIDAGFKDQVKLQSDTHFASMRSLPEFQKLLQSLDPKPPATSTAR